MAATATRKKSANGGTPEIPTASTPTVEIQRINVRTMRVPIIGTAPLIVHRFSEKSKREMLDRMQGRKIVKEARDPNADYEASFYRFEDGGYGFPAIAFKAATVDAARFYGKDVKMTELRQFIFVKGEIGLDGQALVRIEGEPRMREDTVKIGQNTTDLRYRPEFPEWSTTLSISFVNSALSDSSVLSILEAGGLGVGVGEWRPERGGDFGTYMIDPDREVVFEL